MTNIIKLITEEIYELITKYINSKYYQVIDSKHYYNILASAIIIIGVFIL